ncbi:peptidase C15, pyroglutamyl peptidase I-like protein [Schizophyllum commune H4-8]|uniref:Peptidase C15, pyroglutamyl peptidase I-like protein n=1 Tax=Schizophyllum commune (strain H4-8 / FGSC 9210) TaxID=578458 RepID=D8Q8T9_SCHCM|nr:peptidase C15, pyroglutamyl peptidase I-like protein [Schizophyllum commune H4-8]KAI5890674.1 peptidase C15, pyroglutamyl peptidase I-like protein [Schizophyllum commune H4-8]
MTAIKHRVVVTGFGPFRQYTENPSWLAVRTLHDTVIYTPAAPAHHPHAAPEAVHITALEVPVVYDAVLSTVPGLHAAPPVLPPGLPDDFPPPPNDGYSLIVHVGVSRAGPLRLETYGDKTGYNKPDHEGKLADVVDQTSATRGFADERYASLPERLPIRIDPDGLCERCAKDGVNLVPSSDAGHYLCDFILYCSLAESSLSGKATPVLFIHCPPVNQPLSTSQVTDGLKAIIANALSCLHT